MQDCIVSGGVYFLFHPRGGTWCLIASLGVSLRSVSGVSLCQPDPSSTKLSAFHLIIVAAVGRGLYLQFY